MKDKIIHFSVEDEVANFIDVVNLNGSEELITDEAIMFFVARAVSYSNPDVEAGYLVGRVADKVKDSISRYYYKSDDTSDIEKRIIDAWVNLANQIRKSMKDHLYEEDNLNELVVTFKSYHVNGTITVIVCEREVHWETKNGWDR